MRSSMYLSLLCALLAGAFAFEPLNLQKAGDDSIPLPVDESDFSQLELSTRSLLQTYPPTYPPPPGVVPLTPIEDDETPLGEEEDETDPVTVTNSFSLPGNASQRAALATEMLSQLEGGQLELRKTPGRKLLSARNLAEAMLRDMLDNSPLSTGGRIQFEELEENGEVSGISSTFTLFYPSGVSEQERETDAESGAAAVTANAGNGDYNSEFENAVQEAVNNNGNLDPALASQASSFSFDSEDFTVDASSASSIRAGLLGLFVSVAAVLLLLA